MSAPERASIACCASFCAATALLLAPAIWNGFPLMFNDSGAYLAVITDWVLLPGRSVIYGLALILGQWPDFWPVVIAQALVSVWIVWLALRAFDLNRPLVLLAIVAALTVFTALPWLAGELMPDLFVGLAVIAVWLLAFQYAALSRTERASLVAFTVFAAASHSATLLVLALLLLAAAAGWLLLRIFRARNIPNLRLGRFSGALGAGAALVLALNFLVSMQVTWTPGSSAFVFGRLVEDGIVGRFLTDNCPDPTLLLCKFEGDMPDTAIDFLWVKGPFESIGGFKSAGPEMRSIMVQSLLDYPVLNTKFALLATWNQIVTVATGDGVNSTAADAYAVIKDDASHAYEAARAARQAHDDLPFATLNKIHVPVALASLALMALWPLVSALRQKFEPLDLLAVTFSLAILANGFVCGALSTPQDRYGARIAWLAVFWVAVKVADEIRRRKLLPESPSAIPAR